MRISIASTLYVVVFLTCFDSLLKASVAGFYVQAGIIIAMAALLAMLADKNYHFNEKIVKKDNTIIIFYILIAIGLPNAVHLAVYFKMLFYFLVFTLVYIYVSESSGSVNIQRLSSICVLTLCVTGIFQYGFADIFSMQLELRGVQSEHYYYLANRMRGFFLEPNWYGLILFSWLFVYVRSLERLALYPIFLIALSVSCLFLSENRLIYFFLALFIFVYFFGGLAGRLRRFIPVVILLSSGGLFLYLAMAGGLDGDRSAAARFYTGYNVVSTMLSYPLDAQLLGKGFSNWGWFSNELELSWSNYLFDQSLTRRDNSEIYVVFFEMGYLGLLLFIYDGWFLGSKREADTLDVVFLMCMYIAGMFYPIYQFLMYMLPMMIVRNRVVQSN